MLDYLKEGDTVHFVGPSGRIDSHKVEAGINHIREWGIEPVVHGQVYEEDGYFCGTDERRRSALQFALDDENAKLIHCVRGGFGTTRILDELDFENFKRHPKWVVGFSDITSLLIKIENLGFPSIHGTMVGQFGNPAYEESVSKLKKLLHGELSSISWDSDNTISAIVEAKLTGGNLSMVSDSLGTESEIDTDNKILFLEEINEDIYRIDRMLTQLKRAGKFNDIKGLIVGHFTGTRDTQPGYTQNLNDLIREKIPKGIPLTFCAPFGHEAPNYPLIIGGKYRLELTQETTVLEPYS